MNSVLEKYRLDKDGLADFLRNPQKINPDYPPMPNLNLTEQEAGVVADYLFNHETAQATMR